MATDIDTAGLQHLPPSCEVIKHNFLEDPLDGLGPGSFDLVFSRFVLVHLAGKQEAVVRRMIECLRPGGWLVVEDLDMSTFGSADPWHPLAAQFDKILQAMQEGYRNRGMLDHNYGRTLGALFRRLDLINVSQEVTAKIHAGASPVARWHVESMKAITASVLKREMPVKHARRPWPQHAHSFKRSRIRNFHSSINCITRHEASWRRHDALRGQG